MQIDYVSILNEYLSFILLFSQINKIIYIMEWTKQLNKW